jgi:hypothetical protein
LTCVAKELFKIISISDKFHWAFVTTNGDGVAARHEWAPGPVRETAEEYCHVVLDRPRTYTDSHNCILAYFDIRGYNGVEDKTTLTTLFAETFSASFKTIRENRRSNITCRTWIMNILKSLQETGVIKRSDPVGDLESVIINESKAREQGIVDKPEAPYVSAIHPL